jgi:hypothetical protein
MTDPFRGEPAKAPLNRVPQSPRIPVDSYRPDSEKHIRNILDRAMNKSADEQDSR